MIIDVVLKLADMDGAVEQRALMPMEPQRLRHHPFRRNRSGARAVDLQCWIAGGRHLCRHVARAHIHPDERGTQWLPRSIQRHHAAAGGINREGRHLIGPDLRFLHGLAHRPAERTPPIIGILLRPARLWENRRVGGRTKAARLTLQVEHSGAQRLRAAIYTDDVAFGHVLNPVPAGRPSRNPSCESESRTRTGRTSRRQTASGPTGRRGSRGSTASRGPRRTSYAGRRGGGASTRRGSHATSTRQAPSTTERGCRKTLLKAVFSTSSMLATFLKSFENSVLSLSVSRFTKRSSSSWSGDIGIWEIVAHIAFKFHSVASGTFSTGSTFWVRGAVRRVVLNPMV